MIKPELAAGVIAAASDYDELSRRPLPDLGSSLVSAQFCPKCQTQGWPWRALERGYVHGCGYVLPAPTRAPRAA